MVDWVEYRRATREDVEARYPVVPLNQADARALLRQYFGEMKQAVPERFKGEASPVGAYMVNGCVVFHYELVEPVNGVTGYVMAEEWPVPREVRDGDPVPALWQVAADLRR